MRSPKVVEKRHAEVDAKAEKLFNPRASARKKHDWFYAAGYRDALAWVLSLTGKDTTNIKNTISSNQS